mgnify:CR=1 FL=1
MRSDLNLGIPDDPTVMQNALFSTMGKHLTDSRLDQA